MSGGVENGGTKRKLVEYPGPRKGIKWSEFGFALNTEDTTMVIATYGKGKWSELSSEPYGEIDMEPASTVLNYGQGIFEGIKAHRTSKGRIIVFRPQANARRFAASAKQFLMPEIPEAFFLDAVSRVVRENANWVPPCGEGALYLRPIFFGSGPDLGVSPSSEYKFVVFVTPVGKYFEGDGARLKIIHETHRAAPGGVGHVKCTGNYAPCFEAQRDAKAQGFSDILYLESRCEYIDEAAASNFFCLSPDGLLSTPELGTILPGVTRDCLLQLARLHIKLGDVQETNLKEIREGQISVSTALGASEAFLSGTGVGIQPVSHIQPGSLTSRSVDLKSPGPLTTALRKMLRDIQLENSEDIFDWLYDPFEV